MTDFPDLSPEEAASYLDAPTDETELSSVSFSFLSQHGRSFPWRDRKSLPASCSPKEAPADADGQGKRRTPNILPCGRTSARWPKPVSRPPDPCWTGYNRRARSLQQAAKAHPPGAGHFPMTMNDPPLSAWPSTARRSAVSATISRTSIRDQHPKVAAHVFHPGRKGVTQGPLLPPCVNHPLLRDPKPGTTP
jgi:hypothetical protein